MKKIILICSAMLLLSGCYTATKQPQVAQPVTLKFQDEKGGKISLISSDEFESAIMVDKDGKEYYLKRQPSASGVYLEDENGANIHFKDDGGIVEYKKFDTISITAIK